MTKRCPDKILKVEIWQRLADVVSSDDSEWKTPWVTSQRAESGPALRMMVLREVDEEKRELVFFTDSRTPKWRDFAANCRATEVGFWSPTRKVQLRCCGLVSLHEDDEVAENFRSQVSSQRAGDYAAEHPPGAEISSPDEGWKTQNEWHFGVVVVTVNQFDWLRLDLEGHERAQFCWQRNCWSGEWVQP
jgi:pyridoxine/pyridoxamine 5'-phosphate oxidase